MASKQMKCINNQNKHNITIGKSYEIHGECTGDLCRYLLIVDDEGFSKWVGEDMFEEYKVKDKYIRALETYRNLITVGKVYEVTKEDDVFYGIIDNTGFGSKFFKDGFEVVSKDTWVASSLPDAINSTEQPQYGVTIQEFQEAISRYKEYKKQPRIIDLILDKEDENKNISIDLQRVQAVDEVKDNGFYEVLMVSGVKYKLPNSTQQGVSYSRKDVVKAWKTFHNS